MIAYVSGRWALEWIRLALDPAARHSAGHYVSIGSSESSEPSPLADHAGTARDVRAGALQIPVIDDTPACLKAVESFIFGVALLESVVLNKQSGLAVWTKVQPAGLLSEVPESQTISPACF